MFMQRQRAKVPLVPARAAGTADGFAASPGKNGNIFMPPRNVALEPTFTPKAVEGQNTMYDVCQLATAMLAIAFTALLLVTGQGFIEYRLQHEAMTPIVAMATLPR
ncbi:hypothetical protein AB7M17_005618 [Bradyrhizobium sp. USDA 377]